MFPERLEQAREAEGWREIYGKLDEQEAEAGRMRAEAERLMAAADTLDREMAIERRAVDRALAEEIHREHGRAYRSEVSMVLWLHHEADLKALDGMGMADRIEYLTRGDLDAGVAFGINGSAGLGEMIDGNVRPDRAWFRSLAGVVRQRAVTSGGEGAAVQAEG